MSSTVQKRGDMVGWCDYISYNPQCLFKQKKKAERTFLGTKRKYIDPIFGQRHCHLSSVKKCDSLAVQTFLFSNKKKSS